MHAGWKQTKVLRVALSPARSWLTLVSILALLSASQTLAAVICLCEPQPQTCVCNASCRATPKKRAQQAAFHRLPANHQDGISINAVARPSSDCATSECISIQKVETQIGPASTTLIAGDESGGSFSAGALTPPGVSVPIHGPPLKTKSRPIYLITTRLLI